MFKHFSWVQLPKKGAIGIGLFASLFLVSAIQSPASSQTADGTSAIEDSFFEDEGEDDLGNAFEGNLEDGLDENLRIASFSVTTTSEEDNSSPVARFLMSRGYAEQCKYENLKGIAKNIFGLSVYGYFHTIQHCWRGQRVTSVRHIARRGEPYMPLWEFVGHIGNPWSYGNYIGTQGHFRACLGWNGIGCIVNFNPTIISEATGWGRIKYELSGFHVQRSVEPILPGVSDEGIFLSDDLDSSTKDELLSLLKNLDSSSQSVPEPTTLAGLALVGAMLLASKRSRFAKQHPEEAENVTDTTAVEIQ